MGPLYGTGPHVPVIDPDIRVSLVWKLLVTMFIYNNICGYILWNRLQLTVIESNICGSLLRNWHHITVLALEL